MTSIQIWQSGFALFAKNLKCSPQNNSDVVSGHLWRGKASASMHSSTFAFLCLNDMCAQISLKIAISEFDSTKHENQGETIDRWTLWPESSSKVQPEYILQALRADYAEACLIRDKSPKASATLARRCLQGMIRDFFGIQKGTLGGEIEVLRKRVEDGTAPTGVSPESAEGIDAVRSIGSIGAHMENDINIIVDVEPDEAQF